jgi:uncharacterized RDD family membrane protein YckC
MPSTMEVPASRPDLARPALARLLASMLYEGLAVAAILLAGAAAVVGFAAAARGGQALQTGPAEQALLQVFLAGLLGAYFVRCWTRGGQTLAMRAWKLRVVMPDGAPLGYGRAAARFALASVIFGPALVAAAYLWRHPEARAAWIAAAPALADLAWPLVDRDRRLLHDRLTGTRIIFAPPTTSSPRR